MTTIKLYADEHIAKPIISNLKNKGVDIISTDDAGNKSKSDIEQFRFVCANSRTILTMDKDYLEFKDTLDHYGIFIISKRKTDREVVSKILGLLEMLNEEDVKGAVVYI